MSFERVIKLKNFIYPIILSLFAVAFARIHISAEATMVGYELGSLKDSEAELLELRSKLKMDVAKLTTKEHLMLVTGTKGSTKTVAKK